jgi:hypothetical protein
MSILATTGPKDILLFDKTHRIPYRMVHRRIEEGVNFSSYFNVLLLVSSLLAALGLISDNGTTIIAR